MSEALDHAPAPPYFKGDVVLAIVEATPALAPLKKGEDRSIDHVDNQ
jgi:hypothetical protein